MNTKKHGPLFGGAPRGEFHRWKPDGFDRVDIVLSWLCEHHYADCCSEYGEPGYTNPEKGIVFANWNDVPRKYQGMLEAEGFELEWSDEWYVEHNHNKAYRTVGNSYDWQPSLVYTDGDVLTRDDDHADVIDEIAMSYANDRAAWVPEWVTTEELEEAGYELFKGELESGWFPGQTDDPTELAKIAFAVESVERVVFRITENSQFYSRFECWVKHEEGEEHADHP